MKYILLLFASFLFSIGYSQVGKDCANPFIINAVPYTGMGMTTSGFANDYIIPCPTCASSYMSGNDFVFQYTADVNKYISIKLSNITAFSGTVGLFLCDGCPDNASTQCLSKSEGATTPQILNVLLTAGHTYYIIIDTYAVGIYNTSTGFNIEVTESFAKDVSMVRICEPKTGCGLLTAERFVLLFKNIGLDTLYSVPVGYQIDNNAPVYESRNDIALPGQEYYYTFSTFSDLSLPNTTYMIKMFTALPGDGNLINDTLFFPISNNTIVNTFPYLQDFDSNTLGWSTAWFLPKQPNTSWQCGTPSKAVIDHAASGTKCWVTDTIGTNMLYENSYVIGPCFDFSSMTLPILDLDVWYQTGTYDIAKIEYTTDQGWGSYVNWVPLNITPGYGGNWYNSPSGYSESGWNASSGGWKHAYHTLDSLAGKPYVIFRVRFIGGVGAVNDGFAFDNFRISESPVNDLEVESIVSPQSSCQLSAADSVVVKITNHGFSSQHGFQVKCSIDGGLNYVTETVPDTLNFLESMNYKFVAPIDFSSNGIYPIVATTILPADQISANDSAFAEVMSFPMISTFPFDEDFEFNNGHWYSFGLNNSWEWGTPNEPGTPSDSVLTSAGSGLKCWATNLTGNHNAGEGSKLLSPCFDFSAMLNPRLKMKVWYDVNINSYCQFQISDTVGNGYGALGSSSEPIWYNGSHSWIDSSHGWRQVSHALKTYAGKPDIRFQFYFQGLIQKSGFAFDDFEVCDAPIPLFSNLPSTIRYQIQFSNSSLNMDSCRWYFGDGTSSTLTSPFHQYSDGDSVLVKLVVYNSCWVDSISKWQHPFICDAPIPSFSEIAPTKGFQVKFLNSSTYMDSCRWYFGDGTTSNVVNPTHSYPNGDSVLVKLVVYNSCWTDSISKWVHPKFVGIVENKLDDLINLYPNPVKNELTIDIIGELGECVLEISNVQNKVVIEKNILLNQKAKMVIPMNQFSSGIYFVRIKSSLGVVNRKFIKD